MVSRRRTVTFKLPADAALDGGGVVRATQVKVLGTPPRSATYSERGQEAISARAGQRQQAEAAMEKKSAVEPLLGVQDGSVFSVVAL